MRLRPLPPAEARAAWGWIRNGLVTVLGRVHDTWTPEDVYLEVAQGKAHVYAIEWREDDVGFVVLKLLADYDGPCLWVWAMWAEPGTFDGFASARTSRMAEMFRALDELAASVKARRIRMESPRRGWERFFDVKATVYERGV